VANRSHNPKNVTPGKEFFDGLREAERDDLLPSAREIGEIPRIAKKLTLLLIRGALRP
jgi:hypothetical protein